MSAETRRLPADKRTIPLGDISERTKLDKDGVEFLLMKALSLKLIKGTIDEVQQTVQVCLTFCVS
jgi:26S proteasome regulatory subunit N9